MLNMTLLGLAVLKIDDDSPADMFTVFSDTDVHWSLNFNNNSDSHCYGNYTDTNPSYNL